MQHYAGPPNKVESSWDYEGQTDQLMTCLVRHRDPAAASDQYATLKTLSKSGFHPYSAECVYDVSEYTVALAMHALKVKRENVPFETARWQRYYKLNARDYVPDNFSANPHTTVWPRELEDDGTPGEKPSKPRTRCKHKPLWYAFRSELRV
jgi:hypothetical protein